MLARGSGHELPKTDGASTRVGKRLKAGEAKWEMYDLSSDISETKNLAPSNPGRLAELVKIWEKLNSEMVEPLF